MEIIGVICGEYHFGLDAAYLSFVKHYDSPHDVVFVVVIKMPPLKGHTDVGTDVTVTAADTHSGVHVSFTFTVDLITGAWCRHGAKSTPLSAVDDDYDGDDEDETADDDDRRDDDDHSLCYTRDVLDAEQVLWRVPSTNERLSPHCCN